MATRPGALRGALRPGLVARPGRHPPVCRDQARGPAVQRRRRRDEQDPSRKVLYQSYVDPTVALKPTTAIEYEPPRRPDTGRELRKLNLGLPSDDRADQIDLCNGAGLPLSLGYHTLRVIVSDAPWFNPTEDEQTREIGVPDLANGATYDTLEYVFHCDDKSDPENKHCVDQCKPRGEQQ